MSITLETKTQTQNLNDILNTLHRFREKFKENFAHTEVNDETVMSTQSAELTAMSDEWGSDNGEDLTRVACLIHLTSALFRKAPPKSAVVAANLMSIQAECVDAWLRAKGIDPERLPHALEGLRKASETSNYLSKVPK